MTKTEKNLRDAFSGEAQANRKYLAFAAKAADEYMEGVYRLFTAVAESEAIHARRHLGHLKEVGTTEENLREAIAGESHEFKDLYPRMIAQAREEGQKGAEISFNHASDVERTHHALFEEALRTPRDFPAQDYYVCKACGYLEPKEAPEQCPVCGAVRKAFYMV